MTTKRKNYKKLYEESEESLEGVCRNLSKMTHDRNEYKRQEEMAAAKIEELQQTCDELREENNRLEVTANDRSVASNIYCDRMTMAQDETAELQLTNDELKDTIIGLSQLLLEAKDR